MADFFVRPDASHGGTNAGTSFANAWQGWAAINWATLVAGSRLYVCGAFTPSSVISVGAHGGALGNPVTLDFSYATLPGSVVPVTSTHYLWCTKSHTNFVGGNGGGLMHAMLVGGAGGGVSDITVQGLAYSCSGDNVALKFAGGNTEVYADILITGNSFTSPATATNASAVQWFCGTGVLSTFSRLKIQGNTFTDYNASRSILHFRSQTDSTAGTRMADIEVYDNAFLRCDGVCCDFELVGTTSAPDNCAGIKIKRNTYTDCTQNVGGFGGAAIVTGFGRSTTSGWGLNEISDNNALRIGGAVGFIDLLWGSYDVRRNIGDTFNSNTIDANGILFDTGCHDSVAQGNFIKNINGKAGVANSGCGIMFLDGCERCYAYGNIFDTMRNGIFFGASVIGAYGAGNYVVNNTFLNVSIEAVHVSSSASLLGSQIVKNNVFTGTGYKVNDATAITWTGEDYNVFFGFASGNVNHTNGSHDSFADPQIDPTTYKPLPGSPCIGTGAWAGYFSDNSGKPFKIPSSIGANENFALIARAPRI